MKHLAIIILLGLISLTTNAQKIIEKNIDHKNQFIDVEVKFASLIEVKTWDKSTVYFKADITTEDGKFQDKYELDIEEGSNTISIASKAEPVFKAFHDEWNKNNPDKKKRYYTSGDIYEFNYVIYIPKNAKFKISSINGNLKSEVIEGKFEANLINGDIEIAKYSGDLDLNTINGEIDLKMFNVNLVAETVNGEIYTNFDIKLPEKNGLKLVSTQKIRQTINGGGIQLQLKTTNGNIYLRKE